MVLKPRRSLISSTPMKIEKMDEHGIEPSAKRFKTNFSCNPIVINSDDLHNGAGIEVEICYPNFEDNQQNEDLKALKKTMESKISNCIDESDKTPPNTPSKESIRMNSSTTSFESPTIKLNA